MADDRTIVKLKHPVKFGEELVEELAFRRGRLGDLDGLKLPDAIGDVSSLMSVAGRLCGRTSVEMKLIDVDDVGEVLEIAVGFISRCLETGKKPSP